MNNGSGNLINIIMTVVPGYQCSWYILESFVQQNWYIYKNFLWFVLKYNIFSQCWLVGIGLFEEFIAFLAIDLTYFILYIVRLIRFGENYLLYNFAKSCFLLCIEWISWTFTNNFPRFLHINHIFTGHLFCEKKYCRSLRKDCVNKFFAERITYTDATRNLVLKVYQKKWYIL